MLSALAHRYQLAAKYCHWAEARGGRDPAIAEAERIVAKDAENDLDFVVMSVLHAQLEDLTTRSMVQGLVCLGVLPKDLDDSAPA